MTARERLRELVDELPEPEAAEVLRRLEEWRAGEGVVGGLPYGPDPGAPHRRGRACHPKGPWEIDAGDYVGEEELRAWRAELRRAG